MNLTNIQKQELKKMSKKYGLILILAFGSQIKGQAKRESDLDVAVLDLEPETYKRFGDIYLAFSNIFSNYNVDLRFLKGAEPVFLFQVFKNSQLLYGDPQIYYNYKVFAYKNYIDSELIFALKSKIINKRQEKLRSIAEKIK